MAVSIQLAGAGLYEREDSVVRLERGSSRTQCARAEFGGAPPSSPQFIGAFP